MSPTAVTPASGASEATAVSAEGGLSRKNNGGHVSSDVVALQADLYNYAKAAGIELPKSRSGREQTIEQFADGAFGRNTEDILKAVQRDMQQTAIRTGEPSNIADNGVATKEFQALLKGKLAEKQIEAARAAPIERQAPAPVVEMSPTAVTPASGAAEPASVEQRPADHLLARLKGLFEPDPAEKDPIAVQGDGEMTNTARNAVGGDASVPLATSQPTAEEQQRAAAMDRDIINSSPTQMISAGWGNNG